VDHQAQEEPQETPRWEKDVKAWEKPGAQESVHHLQDAKWKVKVKDKDKGRMDRPLDQLLEQVQVAQTVKAWEKLGDPVLDPHQLAVDATAVQAEMEVVEMEEVCKIAMVWVKPGDQESDLHQLAVDVMTLQAKPQVKRKELLQVEV
jgi:hypothetical protein